MRAEGKKVGLVKVRSYRPFPVQALRKALKDAHVIAVVEKDVSIGMDAGLLTDLKSAFYNSSISDCGTLRATAARAHECERAQGEDPLSQGVWHDGRQT